MAKLLAKSRYRLSAGFTLIELLVVMAIVLVVVGLLVVGGSQYMKKTRIQSTRASLEILEAALDEYQVTTGGYFHTYPADEEKFREALEKVGEIHKLTGAVPTVDLDTSVVGRAYADSWQERFRFRIPTGVDHPVLARERPILWSLGPDRETKPENDFLTYGVFPVPWSNADTYGVNAFVIYQREVYRAPNGAAQYESPVNSTKWIATGQIGTWK